MICPTDAFLLSPSKGKGAGKAGRRLAPDDDSLQDLEEDEPPDDIEDETKYSPIPNSRDFGLGKPLVLAFARERLPDDLDEVRYIFSKRGASQKFKTLLSRRAAIDAWHDYRDKATERALRDWCEVHSIEIVD